LICPIEADPSSEHSYIAVCWICYHRKRKKVDQAINAQYRQVRFLRDIAQDASTFYQPSLIGE
jgi:hypothetical protein